RRRGQQLHVDPGRVHGGDAAAVEVHRPLAQAHPELVLERRRRLAPAAPLGLRTGHVALAGGEHARHHEVLFDADQADWSFSRQLGYSSAESIHRGGALATLRPHHVGLTVTDLDRARRWYADALGLELVLAFELPGGVRGLMLRNGAGAGVELFEVPGA